jgi:two-component system, chemotaxis family, sensor kinase Cph1
VPNDLRMACQTIGQVLSLQISAMQTLDISRQREAKMEALDTLNRQWRVSGTRVRRPGANARKC